MGENVVVKDIMEKNGAKCFLGKNVAGKNVVGKNVFGENCRAPGLDGFVQLLGVKSNQYLAYLATKI